MATSTFSQASAIALSVLLGFGTGAIAGCVSTPENSEEPVPDAELVTLFVGPEKVDCVGVAPQKCLQIRYSPDEDYQLFYSPIEGFEHEPGYDYELLVQKTPIENPPADASSIQWTLVEIVSQTPVGE